MRIEGVPLRGLDFIELLREFRETLRFDYVKEEIDGRRKA